MFSVLRVASQAFTCCVSFTHQWAMYSLCCLTFTRQSSMKSILRSLNSLWNLSQVRLEAFNNRGVGIILLLGIPLFET